MPIKYTSGKVVLSKLLNNPGFKVTTTDWIPFIGTYIYDVMFDLKTPTIFARYKQTLPVVNNAMSYPDDFESLEYLLYNEGYVPSKNGGFTRIPQDIPTGMYLNATCTLNPTDITFDNIIDGAVDIYFTKVKTETDTKTGAIIPYIPDNSDVIDAICYKLMIDLILNGYVHPKFNLDKDNKYTNVGMLYDAAIKKARNSIEPITRDMRFEMYKISNNPFKSFVNPVKIYGMVADPNVNIIDVLDSDTYRKRTYLNSSVWTVPHVFGKEPSVQTYNSDNQIIIGNVEQVSTIVDSVLTPTSVVITWDVATTGYAILTV